MFLTKSLNSIDSNIYTLCGVFQIQGAIAVSAIVQIVIGATGLLGLVLRFIGPLTITATITVVGISLFKTAADFCSKQWWIAIM